MGLKLWFDEENFRILTCAYRGWCHGDESAPYVGFSDFAEVGIEGGLGQAYGHPHNDGDDVEGGDRIGERQQDPRRENGDIDQHAGPSSA